MPFIRRIKKETLIIIFYILYFGWLFAITYLTQSLEILNYFAVLVALFYLLFLKEEGDWGWFLLGFLIAIVLGTISFDNWQLSFELDLIKYLPPWLPLAWATTLVALRKFYLMISTKD